MNEHRTIGVRARTPVAALLAASTLALAGCGTMPSDRTLSGAGIGAGAGAIVGAVTPLSVVSGTVLGALAGGLTGALTSPSQVDLGRPAWKQGAADPSPGGTSTVSSIQSNLTRLGYAPGPADGRLGPQTREAIRAYEKDHGLLVDGRASPELAAHLQRDAG